MCLEAGGQYSVSSSTTLELTYSRWGSSFVRCCSSGLEAPWTLCVFLSSVQTADASFYAWLFHTGPGGLNPAPLDCTPSISPPELSPSPLIINIKVSHLGSLILLWHGISISLVGSLSLLIFRCDWRIFTENKWKRRNDRQTGDKAYKWSSFCLGLWWDSHPRKHAHATGERRAHVLLMTSRPPVSHHTVLVSIGERWLRWSCSLFFKYVTTSCPH